MSRPMRIGRGAFRRELRVGKLAPVKTKKASNAALVRAVPLMAGQHVAGFHAPCAANICGAYIQACKRERHGNRVKVTPFVTNICKHEIARHLARLWFLPHRAQLCFAFVSALLRCTTPATHQL